jgi:Putative phage tail protein
MIGKIPHSRIKPQALGVTSNSSTYGQTIPVIYGRTVGALYLIWCANVRPGPSAKKGKSGGSKKGKGSVTTYVANADCLIGTNPIVNILECWDNNNAKLGLNFVKYSTASAQSVTISDSLFYCLLGVTCTVSYNVTFNDYGGTGPQTYSGSYEMPLWNHAYSRPSPGSDFDPLPYFYRWMPGSGPTIRFEYVTLPGATLNFYYAQMLPGGDKVSGSSTDSGVTESGPTPLAALRLTFESELGTGPEFNGTDPNGQPYNLQQILYPHYAGVGSANLDLGAGGMAPAMRFEILGTYPYYPTADADFADMVVDLFGKAVSQAGFAASLAYTQVQHALACYEFPGMIYKKGYRFPSGPPGSIILNYDQPNTAGNFLFAAVSTAGGGPGSISDTAPNGWTPILSSGAAQLWWAAAVAAPSDQVTITGASGSSAEVQILEVAGVDTVDVIAAAPANVSTASIITTNAPGTPAFIFAFTSYAGAFSGSDPGDPHWPTLLAGTRMVLQYRVVWMPGTYSISSPESPSQMALIALKCSQPPNYPKPLGNILDLPSLLLTRNQCRANGLWGSLIMDSQKAASDWLKDLYTAMNAAPVWSGFKLKSIPYSEVSAVGNGAVYTAPTAAGPVADLTESDFIGDTGSPLISVERKAQISTTSIAKPSRSSMA